MNLDNPPSTRAAMRSRFPADGAEVPRYAPVLEGNSPRLFRRIHDPAVDLVIWKRQLPETLRCWLDQLPAKSLPTFNALIRTDDLRPTVEAMLHASRMPAGADRLAFAEDVISLGMLFAATMASDSVDFRLEAIRTDACWKFHRDCVPARLVATYRGPGTEWVHPADNEHALATQRAFAGPINRLPVHAVALYKGSCTEPATGIVHRSPPVAGTGIVRLLLCINTPPANHDR